MTTGDEEATAVVIEDIAAAVMAVVAGDEDGAAAAEDTEGGLELLEGMLLFDAAGETTAVVVIALEIELRVTVEIVVATEDDVVAEEMSFAPKRLALLTALPNVFFR